MATGISTLTAQADARAGLIAATQAALAGETVDPVDTGGGFRWPIVNRDWAFATEVDSDVDIRDIGPRRQLDETITLHMTIGSWRPGDDEATELLVFNRAFYLLGLIQDHIRTSDITLGGVVLWCVPGSSSSAGATTSDDAGSGRLTEIAATFVCRHRIATA